MTMNKLSMNTEHMNSEQPLNVYVFWAILLPVSGTPTHYIFFSFSSHFHSFFFVILKMGFVTTCSQIQFQKIFNLSAFCFSIHFSPTNDSFMHSHEN